jgi:tricorn protease
MRTCRLDTTIFGICLILVLGMGYAKAEEELIGARFPSLSPDGGRVAFSYMGDLWVASAMGGRARRLTDHRAYDGQPVWSPDGLSIAFTSNRMGNDDVYIMSAEGGVPRQLTFHSGSDRATDFTPDGKWVVFRSSRSSSGSIFKIPAEGGNAQPLLDTYWSWPSDARISPDGKKLLFSLGMENDFPWRRGYRGANSSKLWTRELPGGEAKKVFADEANAFWPSWSADGGRIYFVSDRDVGCKNIWSRAEGGDPEPVTSFKEKDVNWLSLAAASPKAVYERDFGLWLLDMTTGESREIPISAPTETKDNRFFWAENEMVSEYRLSPDGKKIAAVVRGEIFVLSSEGGYARNLTKTPWRERDVDWDKTSSRLVYVSDEGANPELYLVSVLGEEPAERLTRSEEDELKPRFSPDGKYIAYYRGKKEMRLYELETGKDELLHEADIYGLRNDPPSWSPDGRYVALSVQRNHNVDIIAVDRETKAAILLTDTAYDEESPAWSPDGRFLLFSGNRFGHSFPEFTGKWDIYQLHLKLKEPEFDEDQFEKLFAEEKEEAPKKKEPKKEEIKVELKLTDIERQTETVTRTLGSETQFLLHPKDGETVYFVSAMDSRSHLWTTSLKEGERLRYEPFVPGVASPQGLQCDGEGKYLYYLSRGRIGRIDLRAKRSSAVSFNTRIRVDRTAEYEQMLGELYYTLKYYYYDRNFHDTDWTEAYQRYRPVLQQVREDRDFFDFANRLIGHLNSSHTGIRGPMALRTEEPSAHVGAEWEFTDEAVLLKRIIKDGPLHDQRDKVSPGDRLTAVNGTPLDPAANLWARLNGQLNKKLVLTFQSGEKGPSVDIAIKAISSGAENRLRLEEWIASRRSLVKEKTDDKAAYIYMRAMGQGDLTRFLKELERDAVPRGGLILDLRNNFGGNVHDRVIQALTKPVYAKWRVRGMSETPQSTFGVADRPVVLLINEVTLSDGEMTANGFKALKRGPIIGNTTYGWLIFTTGVRLLNGGYFRLPFWGCYTLEGEDLERIGGVKPDIFVLNDLTHDLKGEDPQLEAAVEKILELIKR